MSHSISESGNLTAAQRCITIPELASMIVGVRGYAFSDYLRMALSCRAFMDPALDAMWAEHHSLVKLLALFPEGTVDIMNETYQFAQNPVGEDWARFEFYAKRVLHLSIYTSDASMTENVLRTLSIHRRTAWLFPKLQGIEWNVADNARFPYLQLFLHSGITKVGLHPDGRTSLVNIRREPEGPHMSYENVAAISKDLSSLIGHSTSLKRLHMHHPQLTLGADVIEHLALSPNLRVLQLQNEKLDILGNYRGERSKRVLFPCLRSLGAEIEEPKALLNIFRQTATTALGQLTITSKSLIQAAHFSTLITEIARCGGKHLTSLSLSFCSSQQPGQEDQYRLTSALFQPLLALSQIRYLSISCPFIEPDDRLVSQMARAWPELRSLQFDSMFKPIGEIMSQTPLVTLDGVYALIRGCPNLNAVHTPIDTSTPLSPGLSALPLETTTNTICFDFSWSKPTASAAMMIAGLGQIHRSRFVIKETDLWSQARHQDRVVSAQAAGIDVAAYDKHVRTSAGFWRGIGRALNKAAGVVVEGGVTVLPYAT